MKARFDDLVVTRWGARFQGRRMPCAIGRSGISREKREGDGASPAGAHRLVFGLWRGDRGQKPLSRLRFSRIGPRDHWSDDPRDPAYNHLVRSGRPKLSSERLARSDGLYDIVIVSDFNWPEASPGRGSAIFVHRWRAPRRATAGCAAFSDRDLRWILAGWRPWSRLIFQP